MKTKRFILMALVFSLFINAGILLGSCPSGDFTGDCKVDLKDFSLLASQWLDESQLDPKVPLDLSGCVFSLDPNTLNLADPNSVDLFYDATIDHYFCILMTLTKYKYDNCIAAVPVNYQAALADYNDLAIDALAIMQSILKEESTDLPPEIPPLIASGSIKSEFVTIQWGWPKNPFKKELDFLEDAFNGVVDYVNDGLQQIEDEAEDFIDTVSEWYPKGEKILNEAIDRTIDSQEKNLKRVLDNTSEGQLVKTAYENAEETYNEAMGVINAAQ